MTLSGIARCINAHLQRIEADPNLNAKPANSTAMRPFSHAGAWVAGRYVGVRYISLHSPWNMPKAVAEKYLAWLDAGNVGKFDQKGEIFGEVRLAPCAERTDV